MPWFITAILAKKDSIENPTLIVSTQRTFGFFNEYNDAFKTINNNSGDLHEYSYNYLVLEYMESGIHPHVIFEEWYKWHEAQDYTGWIQTFKPNESWGSNWALG